MRRGGTRQWLQPRTRTLPLLLASVFLLEVQRAGAVIIDIDATQNASNDPVQITLGPGR